MPVSFLCSLSFPFLGDGGRDVVTYLVGNLILLGVGGS